MIEHDRLAVVIAKETTPSDGSAAVVVRSPGVGSVEDVPPPGTLLVPGARAGRLRVLGRTRTLVVPEGVRGHVARIRSSDRAFAVEYGQPLFDLTAAGVDTTEAQATAGGRGWGGDDAAPGPDAEQYEGLLAVRASTVGTFYRRPAPDAPAYIEVDQPIVPGTVLALVEVMKVFNQVVYEGPGPAVVRHILVDDGAEVRAGQSLVLVEPAE